MERTHKPSTVELNPFTKAWIAEAPAGRIYTSTLVSEQVVEVTIRRLRDLIEAAYTQHWQGPSGAWFRYTAAEHRRISARALAVTKFAADDLKIRPVDGNNPHTLWVAIMSDLLADGALIHNQADAVVEKDWAARAATKPPVRSIP